jgi:hypothetical protein
MVTMNEMIANMNFWLARLPEEQRQFFFHWLEEHTRIMGNSLLLDNCLDDRFRHWLECLPEEVRRRELFIILGEIAWMGVLHNKVYPYVKIPARLFL